MMWFRYLQAERKTGTYTELKYLQYLTEIYGKPQSMTPSQYKKLLSGRKGIIIFEVSGWGDATGHADLWDGKKVVGNDYGSKSSIVHFWESF